MTDRTFETDPEEAISRLEAGDAEAADVVATLEDLDEDGHTAAVAALGKSLQSDDELVRIRAADALARLCRNDPASLEPVADPLRMALQEADISATAQLRCLLLLAVADGAAVLPVLDDVAAVLDDPALPVRFTALATLEAVGENHPKALAPYVGDLFHVVETADTPVHEVDVPDAVAANREEQARTEDQLRGRAADLLATVAAEQPDAITDQADRLGEVLTGDVDFLVRRNLLRAARELAEEAPDQAIPLASSLAAVLGSDVAPELRADTAGILAILADTDLNPIALAVDEHAEAAAELLATDEPGLVSPVAGLFAFIYEADGVRPEEPLPPLRRLVRDSGVPTHARANAAWALGYAGAHEDVRALRTVEAEETGDMATVARRALDVAGASNER